MLIFFSVYPSSASHAGRYSRTGVDVLLSDCQYRKGTTLYGQCRVSNIGDSWGGCGLSWAWTLSLVPVWLTGSRGQPCWGVFSNQETNKSLTEPSGSQYWGDSRKCTHLVTICCQIMSSGMVRAECISRSCVHQIMTWMSGFCSLWDGMYASTDRSSVYTFIQKSWNKLPMEDISFTNLTAAAGHFTHYTTKQGYSIMFYSSLCPATGSRPLFFAILVHTVPCCLPISSLQCRFSLPTDGMPFCLPLWASKGLLSFIRAVS